MSAEQIIGSLIALAAAVPAIVAALHAHNSRAVCRQLRDHCEELHRKSAALDSARQAAAVDQIIAASEPTEAKQHRVRGKFAKRE